MSRPESRQGSRQGSRRSSVHSEYDDWVDGDPVQRPWPQKMGQLIHDQSAAINMALKTTATEEEKEAARKEAKKRIGSEAIRNTINSIEPAIDGKLEKLITKKKKKETLPSFDFEESTDSSELNSIIKRVDKIYDGKLTFNSKNWIHFLKFLIKEQKRNKLSQDDVIEILRIKLDPYDFEIFETRVEVDGFDNAFEDLRKTYVTKPALSSKIKEFHQYKLQGDFPQALRMLHTKAKYAYPKLTCSQIDEKVFDYLLVNLRDVLLDKMLEEEEKRNDLIEAGFACEKLRGEELFDFLEECAKESNTYVRYCSTEEEELTRKLSELELAKKVSELE